MWFKLKENIKTTIPVSNKEKNLILLIEYFIMYEGFYAWIIDYLYAMCLKQNNDYKNTYNKAKTLSGSGIKKLDEDVIKIRNSVAHLTFKLTDNIIKITPDKILTNINEEVLKTGNDIFSLYYALMYISIHHIDCLMKNFSIQMRD